MIDVSCACSALAKKNVDTRYKSSEAIRNIIIELRDALCERLLHERNEMVLVSILQSLQALSLNEENMALISKIAIEDRRILVRAYAVYALSGRHYSFIKDFFISRLLSEKNPRVRIEILLALYDADFRSVISEIIQIIKSSDYQTQCAAINGIIELNIETNKELVIEALRELLKGNAPKSVISTAETALEALINR